MFGQPSPDVVLATRRGHRPKEQLVIAISGDEGTLTPYTQVTGYPGSNLVALIYDKLLDLDQDNNPKPQLARSIEAASDNSSFVLKLREGVKWQDGKPFTADDVIFSVGYYQKNTVADSAPQLQDVTDVSASGSTVTFTLKRPDPEFPKRLLADMRVLPKHIWQDVKDPSKVTAEQAVGTGPYKLVSYKKDRGVSYKKDQGYEFAANPDYALGKPKLAKISVKIIPQPQTALAALRTREVSMFTGTVPEEQAAGLERQQDIKIARGTGFSSTLLAINNQRAPLDDARVRTAIATAIDRKALVQTVLRGRGTVGAASFWHPDAPGAKVVESTFDPAAAGRLLDEVGAKPGPDGIRVLDGKPMSFDLLVQSTNPQRIRSAELIRDMLKKVGVAVSVSRWTRTR